MASVSTAESAVTATAAFSWALGVPYPTGRPPADTMYRSARGGNRPATRTRQTVAGTPGYAARSDAGIATALTVTPEVCRTTLPRARSAFATIAAGSAGTAAGATTERPEPAAEAGVSDPAAPARRTRRAAAIATSRASGW